MSLKKRTRADAQAAAAHAMIDHDPDMCGIEAARSDRGDGKLYFLIRWRSQTGMTAHSCFTVHAHECFFIRSRLSTTERTWLPLEDLADSSCLVSKYLDALPVAQQVSLKHGPIIDYEVDDRIVRGVIYLCALSTQINLQ